MSAPLVRALQVKAFSAASAAALETAIAAWLPTAGDTALVSVTFSTDGTTFAALILYA